MEVPVGDPRESPANAPTRGGPEPDRGDPAEESFDGTAPIIACRRLRDGARLPARMTVGASGFDLHACLAEPIVLDPGARALIPTGLSIAIPLGFEGCVRARSGLALRHGVGLVNGPGTIDSDYRGEVGVVLINWGSGAFRVNPGDRVAQLVIQPVPAVRMAWAEELPVTGRGDGGFGHTGSAAGDAGR